MFPNLMGQKAFHHLTAEQMGDIIGLSRQAYDAKMSSGRFTPDECKKYCQYFNKPFDFLFATDDEAGITPSMSCGKVCGS